MRRKSVCFVTTVPLSVEAFLRPHIDALSDAHELTVVSNYDGAPPSPCAHLVYADAPLARKISALDDIKALQRLVSLFRRRKFDAVLTVTPKAGLLGMLAARIAGVPIRVHWFTGQVWASRSGVSRFALKAADRVIAQLSTHLLADSPSQRDFLGREGVSNAERIAVLGDGSICGVDASRFKPDSDARERIRNEHGIPPDALVVLFLGRLNSDKGVRELAGAASHLNHRHAKLHWMIVGPDEGGMVEHLRTCVGGQLERLHFQGFTAEPERYMAAADIFCLPSYREGFGSSVLEAAAVGIPSVATRIYGLTDAVSDGESGLLVPARDTAALSSALEKLLTDAGLRKKMGLAARKRAIEKFAQQRLTTELHNFLQNIMNR